MKVYLIRHTMPEVPIGMCYGQTDVPLAPSFEEDAAITLSKLKQYSFDRVYSSPLFRCVHLADYCGFPQPILDNRLKEMNFGEWEMQYYDQIKDERLQAFFDDYLHVSPTGGESFPMFYQRVSSFLDELKSENISNAALFTHGGVQVCAMIYAHLVQIEDAYTHSLSYGSILEIDI
jgi:alpha-ribazole phosphatase